MTSRTEIILKLVKIWVKIVKQSIVTFRITFGVVKISKKWTIQRFTFALIYKWTFVNKTNWDIRYWLSSQRVYDYSCIYLNCYITFSSQTKNHWNVKLIFSIDTMTGCDGLFFFSSFFHFKHIVTKKKHFSFRVYFCLSNKFQHNACVR